MVTDITREVHNKNFAMRIFIDLSKAFDTVDHSLLIKKNAALWNQRHLSSVVLGLPK